LGANFIDTLRVNIVGAEMSIIKPNIQKTKGKGGGTKADTNHKPAAIEKPYRISLYEWACCR